MAKVIQVLIADDSKHVRKAIRAYLEETENIRVVGEASDGVEAVRIAEKLMPDVILLDILMPKMDGVQVLSHLRKTAFNGKVLAISAAKSLEVFNSLLKFGVAGYLTKENPHELVQAIRSVASGGKEWISPSLKQQIET